MIPANKNKPKKRRKRFVPTVNEPVWEPDSSDELSEMTRLLNWYSYNKSNKDAKKYLQQYCKQNGGGQEFISALKDSQITPTYGWVARIIINSEVELPEKYLEKFYTQLTEYKNKGKEVLTVKKRKEVKNKNVVKLTVQDRINEQVRHLSGLVEGEIDDFVESGCKSEFSLLTFFRKNEIKSIQAKRIGESFIGLRDELKEAYSGKCEQLNEGYSFLTKKQLKKYLDFVNQFIIDTEIHCGENKQKRNRKKKPKPAWKLVEKVQYQIENKEYGLKSQDPKGIIGASQLWIFNTKYKRLGVYYAEDERGLSVKGTTLQNVDVERSVEKRLRKPNEILPQVLEGGKVKLRKIMSNIRTKDVKATGRLGKDTIIMRILK